MMRAIYLFEPVPRCGGVANGLNIRGFLLGQIVAGNIRMGATGQSLYSGFGRLCRSPGIGSRRSYASSSARNSQASRSGSASRMSEDRRADSCDTVLRCRARR